MPSKDIVCEFCKDGTTCRKNELARHVKSKHKKELANYILEEYINEPSSNCLKRYAGGINPSCNPVYSKLYEGSCYYFGTSPMFFSEDDSYGTYIKSDENMKTHNEFLTEIVSNITLTDFFKAESDIIVKSKEYSALQRNKWNLDKQVQELKEEVELLRKDAKYKQQIINEFKEATNCSSTIEDMKNEINSLNSSMNYYKNEAERLQQINKNIQENEELKMSEICESEYGKRQRIEEELDALYKAKYTLQKECDDMKASREAYANTKIIKEVDKAIQKIQKKHEQAIEKIEKNYEQEIEDKDKEINKLKKQIKKNKYTTTKKNNSDDDDSD
jgi:DNA repair exonuclease SbcCD ATPase subunit